MIGKEKSTGRGLPAADRKAPAGFVGGNTLTVVGTKPSAMDMKKQSPDFELAPLHFRPGARVRLSKLGEMRNPRKSVKVGRVVSVSGHKSGSASVLVQFDGLKEPTRLHWTYVEHIKPHGKDTD